MIILIWTYCAPDSLSIRYNYLTRNFVNERVLAVKCAGCWVVENCHKNRKNTLKLPLGFFRKIGSLRSANYSYCISCIKCSPVICVYLQVAEEIIRDGLITREFAEQQIVELQNQITVSKICLICELLYCNESNNLLLFNTTYFWFRGHNLNMLEMRLEHSHSYCPQSNLIGQNLGTPTILAFESSYLFMHLSRFVSRRVTLSRFSSFVFLVNTIRPAYFGKLG